MRNAELIFIGVVLGVMIITGLVLFALAMIEIGMKKGREGVKKK